VIYGFIYRLILGVRGTTNAKSYEKLSGFEAKGNFWEVMFTVGPAQQVPHEIRSSECIKYVNFFFTFKVQCAKL
jgi:hypothetical protein